MVSRSSVILHSCFSNEAGSETLLQIGVPLYEMVHVITNLHPGLPTNLHSAFHWWRWTGMRFMQKWWLFSFHEALVSGNLCEQTGNSRNTPTMTTSFSKPSPWNQERSFADLSPFQEGAQFKGLEYKWNRGHIFSVFPKRVKHWL